MLSLSVACIYVNSEWAGTFTEIKLLPRHYTSRFIVKHDILNTQTVVLQISLQINAACLARSFYTECHKVNKEYILAHGIRISEIVPWDRKYYLTRLSNPGCHVNTLVVLELTHMVVK